LKVKNRKSKGNAAVTEKSQKVVNGKGGSGTMSVSMKLNSGKPMTAESDPQENIPLPKSQLKNSDTRPSPMKEVKFADQQD